MGHTTTIVRFPEDDDSSVDTEKDKRGEGDSAPDSASRRAIARMHGIDHEDELSRGLSRWRNSATSGESGPRFVLAGRLGQGSQGQVFALRDRDCQRVVALKTLLGRQTDHEDVSRFLHEVQVTAQLEHPGIVPVHDVGVLADGTVFYTMKRVEGASLQEWQSGRAGSLEHRFEVIQLFLKLCDAMAFAHSRSVVHRDLKPRNIMVGTYGEVLVMDWGLAKVLGRAEPVLETGSDVRLSASADHETMQGTAVGTPAYMSPEQARGDLAAVDHRADIYAMGVLLYELLGGASPYIRGEVRRTIQQVVDGRWKPLDQQPGCQRMPRRLVAIVHKAMALRPDERYQHVSEMAADLRAFLAGEAVSAHRETFADRLARKIDQNRRAIAWWSLGVVVVIGASLAASWWIQRRDERTVAALREDAARAVAASNFTLARQTNERILGLRPNDREAQLAAGRFEEIIRSQNERQVKEATEAELDRSNRAKAAELRGSAAEVAAKGGIEDLVRASELCKQAQALAPQNRAITDDYERYRDEAARLRAVQRNQDEAAQRMLNAKNLADKAALAEKEGRLDDAIGALTSSIELVSDAARLAQLKDLASRRAAEVQRKEESLRQQEQRAARDARRVEADHEIDLAEARLAAGDAVGAQDHVERAAALIPDHPALAAIRERVAAGIKAARAREAEGLLAKAGDAIASADGLRSTLSARGDDVRRLTVELGDSGDPARRAALASAEEACRGAARDRAARLADAIGLLNRALAIAPDHPPVRAALAGYWIERLRESDDSGDIAGGAAAEAQARAFDDGAHRELLSGTAKVVNRGDSPLLLRAIARREDRTEAASGDGVRIKPGESAQLSYGRYLAVTEAGVREAVRLERGRVAELALPAPPADLLPGCAFVPGGIVHDPDGRSGAQVQPFVMQVREVTCGDWVEFLNDPATQAAIAAAMQRGDLILAPRRSWSDDQPMWRRRTAVSRFGGAFLLQLSDDTRIDPGTPVSCISHDDAVAYAGWRARRDGRAWRLPTVAEWEFAVQGGDGRSHPWGEAADLSLCASWPMLARDQALAVAPGGRFAADCSVQGVFDLAGSRCEYCAAVPGMPADLRPVMGGSVTERQPERFSAWGRQDVDHRLVNQGWGVRLVYTP